MHTHTHEHTSTRVQTHKTQHSHTHTVVCDNHNNQTFRTHARSYLIFNVENSLSRGHRNLVSSSRWCLLYRAAYHTRMPCHMLFHLYTVIHIRHQQNI